MFHIPVTERKSDDAFLLPQKTKTYSQPWNNLVQLHQCLQLSELKLKTKKRITYYAIISGKSTE